ncbi:MAG: restriction endonuclease [Alphaproteobacteria bacterium]|nr:restriction endonuclease [Alphaproteobacteria bacterium]
MLLDFTEIPQAHGSDGKQDSFELFAREFLELIGLRPVAGPDRGPDDGRDLIVEERLEGTLQSSTRRWLVSCKHKAHSGNAVSKRDEEDIPGRVDQHHADGFITFYSTVPSSALSRHLASFTDRFEVQVFDQARIEQHLVTGGNAHDIVRRYFPVSYARWEAHRRQPANILDEYLPLPCEITGTDLLRSPNYSGIIVFAEMMHREYQAPRRVEGVYAVSKGQADRQLSARLGAQGFADPWVDISDLTIPTKYLGWVISILNGIHNNDVEYSTKAFDQLKSILIALAQYVMRNMSDEERERFYAVAEFEASFRA